MNSEGSKAVDRLISTPGNVRLVDALPPPGDSRSEVMNGLRQAQKTVDPKWFYDARGSELFAQITGLPEYYPTRTEIGILQTNKPAIARRCGTGSILIEPGSGNAEKVRLLLDELRPLAYVPLEISAELLNDEAIQLGLEYPWLQVYGVCTDFKNSWSYLDDLPPAKRVVFYPGSTLGNLEPEAAAGFLAHVRQVIGEDGGLLIGVDMHKSSEILHAAYNDDQGITAEFNLNVLNCLNELLDANFHRERFLHRAFYDEQKQRIEMHLVSETTQSVRCNGELVHFETGESIHTENSYKYTTRGFAELAASAGLFIEESWYDADRLFGVHYLGANPARAVTPEN